jgi:hypothetical protein
MHKSEPGFSFMIEPHRNAGSRGDLVEVSKDPRAPVRTLRLTEILFKLYYDALRPSTLDAAAEGPAQAPP